MIEWMAIVNLTPDSFYAPSRVWDAEEPAALALERIRSLVASGASIIDLGAVSTRPGAAPVGLEEEWRRLRPVLRALREYSVGGCLPFRVSIDTTRAEIVRRATELVDGLIINDISAGEDDPEMLPAAASLGLTYVAMHKRGTPETMDSLCDYPDGVMPELLRYFRDFAERAAALGLQDWILDPGLGFAKTPAQCWEILERLPELAVFGRPILIGAGDKRFTREVPERILKWFKANGASASVGTSTSAGASDPAGASASGGAAVSDGVSASAGASAPDGTAIANALAVAGGATILRVHEIRK